MKGNAKTIFGWVLIASGCTAVVALRFASVDMTEGRAFLNFLPYWAFAAGLVVAGAYLLRKSS